MKISGRKLRLLFIPVFSIFICTCVCSQTIEQCITYADSQSLAGNYQLAIKEYQRALFFDQLKYRNYLFFRLGECHFQQKDYPNALKYFDRAASNTRNDSEGTVLMFKKVMCCLFEKDFFTAQELLLNLSDSIKPDWLRKKNLYLAIAYFGTEDYDKSEFCFTHVLDSTHVREIAQIRELFRNDRNLYRPNPETAFYMSMFLPGSGQIYAGDVKNGINSLLLTGSLCALGFYTAYWYSIFDALLAVFPWFQRYYQGGYIHAREIAREKRAQHRKATYNQIMEIIDDMQM